MRIIPAIDIIDGKCVRLTKGDYSTQKVYFENPLEFAKELEDVGLQYLHLVDLDGAKSSQIINYNVLELLASKTNLKIDFGGGIKSNEDIEIAFNAGASQVTCGSIAVSNQELVLDWVEKYGSEKIILGADVNNKKIATHGWKTQTEVELSNFVQGYEEKGLKYLICTDISKDGMLQGSSIELYQEIMSYSDMNLIASGGVSSIEDLLILKEIGCEGAIVGKAIYENRISIYELKALC
jgi:phosphoribosylformimino-5-aminoimidazole carboxamide ribotide isomerase